MAMKVNKTHVLILLLILGSLIITRSGFRREPDTEWEYKCKKLKLNDEGTKMFPSGMKGRMAAYTVNPTDLIQEERNKLNPMTLTIQNVQRSFDEILASVRNQEHWYENNCPKKLERRRERKANK